MRYVHRGSIYSWNKILVLKPWWSSPIIPPTSFSPPGGWAYRMGGKTALRGFCYIRTSTEVSTPSWDCGNGSREGARWQGVGSPRLEKDGQDKHATGGLRNERINIQTKVNSDGEDSPVSTAREVWTYEFSPKHLRELVWIWVQGSPSLLRREEGHTALVAEQEMLGFAVRCFCKTSG